MAQNPGWVLIGHTGSGWVHARYMEFPPVSTACVQSLVCDLCGRTGMVAGYTWVQVKAAVSPGGGEAWCLATATSRSPLQGGPCNPFRMMCSPSWSCTQEVAVVIAVATCGSSSGPCRCQLQEHGVTQMSATRVWGPTGISCRHRVRGVCARGTCSVLGAVCMGLGWGARGFAPGLWASPGGVRLSA